MNTPTLREELDRKVFETIEKVVSDKEHGRINRAQYDYAVDTLWSVAAGLVDKDFTAIMERMGANRVKDGSFFSRCYFLGEKGHTAKITNLHDGRVKLELLMYDGTHNSERVFDSRDELDPQAQAKQRFDDLCDGLVARGFLEI